jgi:uncharacterized protein YwgA
VQLQKVLFLLGKQLPGEIGHGFYDFIPYNYGPFDSAVYADASMLAGLGFVNKNDSGRGFLQYAPTAEGMSYASKLRNEASPKAAAYLEKIVPWAQALSFSALVRAIYAKYPEYRENSVFQG